MKFARNITGETMHGLTSSVFLHLFDNVADSNVTVAIANQPQTGQPNGLHQSVTQTQASSLPTTSTKSSLTSSSFFDGVGTDLTTSIASSDVLSTLAGDGRQVTSPTPTTGQATGTSTRYDGKEKEDELRDDGVDNVTLIATAAASGAAVLLLGVLVIFGVRRVIVNRKG